MKGQKQSVSLEVNPLTATTALGVAQLCMLRFFEEMNLQPKDQRLFSLKSQKEMMHVISLLYHQCMDTCGIRAMLSTEDTERDLKGVKTAFSSYMGLSLEDAV